MIGPAVEELYFRGYLLPRMRYLGIIGFAPTVYAVNRWRNVPLGMVVHCTLNIIGVASVSALVLGQL